MSDLRQSFLDAMSSVAATVSVVATDGPKGRAGVTVSAMSSVSADTEKPVLLICVNEQSSGAEPLTENGVFSVNILRDDQSFVSDTFAGRFGDKGEDKFACAQWSTAETGAPLLDGALANFDCRLTGSRKIGQHHVLFGAVEEVRLGSAGRALIYANRSYGTPLSLPPVAGRKATQPPGRISIACLASFAPFYLPSLLTALRKDMPSVHFDVLEGDQSQVINLVETGQAAIGLLYGRDLPPTLNAEQLGKQLPYVLLPASDERCKLARISLHDLVCDPLVLLDQPLSRDYVLGLFECTGKPPAETINAANFETARSLVGGGFGYSILVTQPAGNLTYDGQELCALPLAEVSEGVAIVQVQREEADASTRLTTLRVLIGEHFATLEGR